MPLVSDSPTLQAWITAETRGASCVVDLGAGFFDKLRYVPPMARKIGVDVFPAYLGFAPPGVTARLGDIREWDSLIQHDDCDVAMMIDVIDHMSKADGVRLLRGLKDVFRKILVMTPDGFVEQNEDVTGYENEWQVHECGWTAEELAAEGFKVELKENFHAHMGIGALFATWSRSL